MSLWIDVTVFDPWVDQQEVSNEYGISVINNKIDLSQTYSVILLAVSHDQFLEMDIDALKEMNSVVFDIKGFLPQTMVDKRL